MNEMQSKIERLHEGYARAKQFVTRDVWRLGRPGAEPSHGFLLKQVRVSILLVRNFVEDDLLLRASALTFATILSIVPLLTILFYLIQSFNLGEGLYQVVNTRFEEALGQVLTFADFKGEGEGESEPAAEEDTDSGGEDLGTPDTSQEPEVEAAPDRGEHVIPGAEGTGLSTVPEGTAPEQSPSPPAPGSVPANTTSPAQPLTPQPEGASIESKKERLNKKLIEEMSNWLFQGVGQEDMTQDGGQYENPVSMLIAYAESGAGRVSTLGISAVVLVLTTVLGLMRNIELSFAQIWRTPRTRPWYRMFSDYILVTLLLPFVSAVVIAISVALKSETVESELGLFALPLRGVQYVVIMLAFAGLYAVVPNTRVNFRYALVGGIVAGLGWVLMSQAYVAFQFGLAKFNVIYSSFAQFPLLLMWMYASWIIFLFGAELTYAYQYEKTFTMERLADSVSEMYREAVALKLALEMARRFDAGEEPLAPQEMAEAWRAPTRLLNDILDQLTEAGLVSKCATDPVRYQPARSLDRVHLCEVVETLRTSGEDLFEPDKDKSLEPFVQSLRIPRDGLLGYTLAEAVRHYNNAELPKIEELSKRAADAGTV